MANIEFFLNGTPRQCHVAPDTSILVLLREHLGATGTKEGCASGDCGACTVAIVDPHAPAPAYKSINACMTPAHQLQGMALVTVEGLASNGRLHPAQAAMVECHGSQCGFCTPGVVMSLFTLYETSVGEQSLPSPEQLDAALGGNLCRCTGYRPIRDAALQMLTRDQPAGWTHEGSLGLSSAQSSVPPPTDDAVFFYQPDSLEELTKARARYPQARLVAGATDLWLETTQQLKPLDQLIDITRVKALSDIETANFNAQKGWWIGAGVTYTQLEPLLNDHFPSFAHLLHRLGSQQIRNRGTLGGNIANASPIGDTPPVLLTLGAWVELASISQTRQLPLEDFFLGYKKTALAADEIVSRIFIPRLGEHTACHAWKLSKRREDDISAVLGAFAYRLENGRLHDVRIAFGGMAAIPKRALKAEQALEGKPADANCFRQAQAALEHDFSPMDDVRGSAQYRRLAAANLFERLYLTLSTPSQEVMLHAYAH
ncbi:xanthine dehydrogenase small subunit [Halomonas aquamarina]|uniref:Xanthine dehydrogenase small subunit n=1 Tax=Vreelandella aquamarina TaxID=77097 RepID=A0ACC5VV49_9GAMM|nr:xanthine dehydrogenase small subunit [Halomonas aquamarina]MBZ5487753.1 xanthine dehydrogenase small subunit [Halomonas aquamarina]